VDTSTLYLHAQPPLKAALEVPPNAEERQLLHGMREGDQALQKKGLHKQLGLWSMGQELGPLLAARCLLAGTGVQAILEHLLMRPKTAEGLGDLYEAAARYQQPNFIPPTGGEGGCYLALSKLGGGEALQQAFLDRARSSLKPAAEDKLQPMEDAREADKPKPFVTIRLGQTGDFHTRSRQIFFDEPRKLKRKLEQGILTTSLTQAVQESFVHTYPDGSGSGDYIYYKLMDRANLRADARLGPVEDGMDMLLWVVLRNDTEVGGTLCFGLHRSECDYGTASSVGGNADFNLSFSGGPPRNNPLSLPGCPLFPGETGDYFVRWLNAQGGNRNQELALASERLITQCRCIARTVVVARRRCGSWRWWPWRLATP